MTSYYCQFTQPTRNSPLWDWEWEQLEKLNPRLLTMKLPIKPVCPDCMDKERELTERFRTMLVNAQAAVGGWVKAIGKDGRRLGKLKNPQIKLMSPCLNTMVEALKLVKELLEGEEPDTFYEHTASEWYQLLGEMLDAWQNTGPVSPATMTRNLKFPAVVAACAEMGLVVTFRKEQLLRGAPHPTTLIRVCLL